MSKRLGIAATVASFVFILGLVLVPAWQHFMRPRVDIGKLTNPEVRIEMMHESTQEWMEKHFPDMSGKDVKTQVFYRDGNVGWRIFRADYTLAELTVHNTKGVELVHLFFSPKGNMVVSGFEKRNNGTMRRSIEQDGNNVHTVTFWQDGKTVFADEWREVDAWERTVNYFHPNGARWVVRSKTGPYSDPSSEAQYDDENRPVRAYDFDEKAHTGVVLWFYGNGKVRIRQIYLPYDREEADEGGSYTVTYRGLRFVEELDPEERMVRRIMMKVGGKEVEAVAVFDPATGEQIAAPANATVPPELTNSDIKALKPVDAWKAEEAKVSALVETK